MLKKLYVTLRPKDKYIILQNWSEIKQEKSPFGSSLDLLAFL